MMNWKYNDGAGKTVSIWQEGAWTFKAEIEADLDHDFGEGRGKFTDVFEENCIPAPHNAAYRFFCPVLTLKERSHYLEALGYSKEDAVQEAKRQVEEDMLLFLNPEASGYNAYAVSVTVFLCGVELGADSLCGIEVRGDPAEDPYIAMVAKECVRCALLNAKKKLEELKKEGE